LTIDDCGLTIEESLAREMTPEELKKRTKSFALRVLKLVDELPKGLAGQVIGKQLLRSATSASRKTARTAERADVSLHSRAIVNRQASIVNSSDPWRH
jgi:hypothetical protein